MNILIVEDNDESRNMLESLLKGRGYDVISATNGVEAIERLKKERFDMIISDILMPKMDGFSLCRKCKSDDTLRKIPFVFYTATYTDKKDEEFALSLGAEKFIVKPVEPDKFLEILEAVIEEHEAGTLAAPKRPVEDETVYLAEYNKRLIEKLEHKALDLEKELAERKRAEKALRRERDKAQRYLDVAGVMLVAIDTEQRVGLINKKGCDILGYKEEEILGKNWFDNFLPSRIKDEAKAVFEKLIRAEVDAPEYSENPILTKSGDERLMAWHNTVLRDEKGRIIATLSSGEDITERKKSEEALRESEEKYRKLYENAPVMLNTLNKKGVLLDCNKAFQETIGYRKEEMIGKPVYDFETEESRKLAPHALEKVAREGTIHGERDFITKDGKLVTLEFSAHIECDEEQNEMIIKSASKDITERKQAEQSLQAAEAELKHTIEVVPCIIIKANAHTGYFINCNPALSSILGFSFEEFLARPFIEFIHPDDRQSTIDEVEKQLKGSPVAKFENRYICKDGSYKWLEWRATAVDEKGAVYAAATDITERKKAEKLLKDSEERLKKHIDSIAMGISIISPKMEILDMNEIFKRWFPRITLSKKPKCYKSFYDPPKEEICTYCPTVKAFKDGKDHYSETDLCADGNYYLVAAAPLKDESGKVTAVIETVQDITERKKAEEALRESEKHYRMLAETMNDGLGQVDENGRYVYVNNKFGEMFGYSTDEIVGRSWSAFFDEDAQKIINEQLIERRKGISKPYELENTRKDGQKIFLRISPQAIFDTVNRYMGSISILTDITERKQAEEQIAKLAKFPAENPNPVLRISGHGTVIFANKAGSPLLKSWRCRVGESLPEPWHELVMDALSSGQSQQTEVQCEGRIFSLTFAPVVNANYVNVYGHDITERKKAEDKLFEDQVKLKAMASEMLLTEEHERQRLAMGLHDEVCQKLVLTKFALESSMQLVSDSNVLASLRIACGAIGETIEQADSLTFELSNPVLRQLGFVIALEKYLTEEIRQKHGIEYEFQSDEQLGTLQDEIKNCLFRVTRELLTNVVKHAHAHKVMVSVHKSQSQIYIRVQDDGVGFEESQAGAKVSQTARFGLFSIREQLEYLGGHLEIDSVPGGGTKATVVVPLRDKATV